MANAEANQVAGSGERRVFGRICLHGVIVPDAGFLGLI
jgi:hypothetical protein